MSIDTILNFQKIVGMAVMQYDNTGLYNEVCTYLYFIFLYFIIIRITSNIIY